VRLCCAFLCKLLQVKNCIDVSDNNIDEPLSGEFPPGLC
jgi:hypothetical protein